MPKNIGAADRVVRILLAIGACAVIYLQLLDSQVANIVVGVVGVYLLLSGLLGRCIFYKMLDVDTAIQEQPYSTTDDRAGFR
jgi:DMSO reductase anchor subunit